MKIKQPTNRKRQWLAFFTVGLLLFSVFYACKTIDEEPSIQTIYSQGQLLSKAQEHWDKMLKKYNKKTKGALLFRHIHPQWHRNSIVKEGIYNNEYLKVEISKNAHYNVEMYYNATGKEQKGFLKCGSTPAELLDYLTLKVKCSTMGISIKVQNPNTYSCTPR